MKVYNSPYKIEVKTSQIFSDEESKAAFIKLVSIIEHYHEEEQFALIAGRRIHFDQVKSLIVQRSIFVNYIKDNLFLIAEEQMLPFSNKKELMQRMNACDFCFPQDLEKTKAGQIKHQAKYVWCEQNANIIAPIAYPELVTVVPSELLQKGGEFLADYISRKFCDVIYTLSNGQKVQVPEGASMVNYETFTYRYPNDIVTEMLNQYGHNRCEVYTKPREIHNPRSGKLHFTFAKPKYKEQNFYEANEMNF